MGKTFFRRLIITGFILTFQMPFLSHSGEIPSPDILNAAQEGIKIFLKDAQTVDLHQFGFSSREEADGAVLGEGFQIFTVSPDSLLKEGASQDLHSLATPTNLWQFIVVAGEKARALLTVDLMNHKWIPVSIGASGLAQQLGNLLETYPLSAGYDYRLIRVYQAKSDFAEISQDGKVIGIIPLTSARLAMGLGKQSFDARDLYSSEDVVTKIRPIVRKNIQMEN